MKFIELFQQGGYALPQYGGGQQTYQVPQIGMQVLGSMMQGDQMGFQQQAQLDQLRMQQEQLLSSRRNDAIKTSLQFRQQNRQDKRYDLENKKLEFEMSKSLLSEMDAADDFSRENYLPQDQQNLNDILEKGGMTKYEIMTKFKNTKDWESAMNDVVLRSSVIKSHKQAMTNKQILHQSTEELKDAYEKLDRMNKYVEEGIINVDDYEKMLTAITSLNNATANFKNNPNTPENQALLDNPMWEQLRQLGPGLDVAKAMEQVRVDQAVKQANTEVKLMEVEKLKMQMPFLKAKLMMEQATMLPDFADVTTFFANNLPGVDMNNPDSLLTAYSELTPRERELFGEALEEFIKKRDAKAKSGQRGVGSMDYYKQQAFEAQKKIKYNEYKNLGYPDELALEMATVDAYRYINTKFYDSNKNIKTDSKGRQYKDLGDGVRQYPGGYTANKKGELQTVNFSFNEPIGDKLTINSKLFSTWGDTVDVEDGEITLKDLKDREYTFKTGIEKVKLEDENGKPIKDIDGKQKEEERAAFYIDYQGGKGWDFLTNLGVDQPEKLRFIFPIGWKNESTTDNNWFSYPNFNDFNKPSAGVAYIKNMFGRYSKYDEATDRFIIILSPYDNDQSTGTLPYSGGSPAPYPGINNNNPTLPSAEDEAKAAALNDYLDNLE